MYYFPCFFPTPLTHIFFGNELYIRFEWDSCFVDTVSVQPCVPVQPISPELKMLDSAPNSGEESGVGQIDANEMPDESTPNE